VRQYNCAKFIWPSLAVENVPDVPPIVAGMKAFLEITLPAPAILLGDGGGGVIVRDVDAKGVVQLSPNVVLVGYDLPSTILAEHVIEMASAVRPPRRGYPGTRIVAVQGIVERNQPVARYVGHGHVQVCR
jgi:hypothetical protein